MSATPGPVQRSPSRRNDHRAAVPAGNTVSGCPSRATAGPPSPGRVTTRLRAGLSGSSTHSCVHPAGASQAPIRSATASCSVPSEGESMSTRACSRSQKTSLSEAAKAPVTLLNIRCLAPAMQVYAAGMAAVLDRAFVRASGPDAVAYLQSMVSNDVEAVAPGGGTYALLLTPKARVIADLEVFRVDADLVLACPPQAAGDVLETLVRARFRKKVALDPAGLRPRVGRRRRRAGRARDAGRRRAPAGGGARQRCGDGGRWELARIEAGMPRFGHEFDGASMPAEAGLETRAISFTKGCYPGQEPVARLHYRGHANRGVRGLRFDGAAAARRRRR